MTQETQHTHQDTTHQGPITAAEDKKLIQIPAESKRYTSKEVKFNFRKNVELGTKRPSVTLALKVLTLEGLVDILEGGDEKEIALVLETLQAPILAEARNQVDENESINSDTIDHVKLTWNFISRLEPAARRGGGIPKETWEAFVADYIEVMPAITGKTADQVTRAASLLGSKLSSVKGNKPVLGFLRQALDLYFTATNKTEEFVECYEFLVNKADSLLKASDEELLKNL
jgi:hypothetical protein